MKKLIYYPGLIICFALNSNYLLSQRPLTQIEGLVEVYDNLDSTSLYIGLESGKLAPASTSPLYLGATFLGTHAGKTNSFGLHNTLVGFQSGLNIFNGDNNSFFGAFSGMNNLSSNNSFIGFKSGSQNISGRDNSFFGSNAGRLNTSGSYNTFLGFRSGQYNTTGRDNTYVGGSTGEYSTTGSENTFVGEEAGNGSTTGSFNTFIGSDTGYGNKAGSKNTYLGYYSGERLQNGMGNTFLGYKSGSQISLGDSNIIVGNGAGPLTVDSISKRLMIDVKQSDSPLIYGEFDNDLIRINGTLEVAGLIRTPVFDSTSIYLPDMTPDSVDQSLALSNVVLGKMASQSIVNGSANITIGHSAGALNTSGNANVYLGHKAGQHMTTANSNVLIGFLAGENVDGSGNVFIGNKSAQRNSPTELSNRLHISNGPDPLIYGEFDNQIARVNGELQVEKNDFVFRNIGDTEDNTGIKWLENTSAVFGLVYDGEGSGDENRLHLRKYLGGDLDIMTYKVGGNVGIGVSDPQETLDVLGNIRVRGVGINASSNDIRIDALGNLTTSMSDVRLKENIEIIPNALDKISQLRGISFTWRADSSAGVQHGIIAQDVQKVAPELVFERDGYLGVDYSEMIGLLIESLKALKIENDILKSRITIIENQ